MSLKQESKSCYRDPNLPRYREGCQKGILNFNKTWPESVWLVSTSWWVKAGKVAEPQQKYLESLGGRKIASSVSGRHISFLWGFATGQFAAIQTKYLDDPNYLDEKIYCLLKSFFKAGLIHNKLASVVTTLLKRRLPPAFHWVCFWLYAFTHFLVLKVWKQGSLITFEKQMAPVWK